MNQFTGYPGKFVGDQKDGYSVTFRDVPEAITQGDNLEKAKQAAHEALMTAFDFYFEDRKPFPIPSAPQLNEVMVSLPVSSRLKLMFLEQYRMSGITSLELARRMQIKPHRTESLLTPSIPNNVDMIEYALAALGFSITTDIAPLKS